MALRIGITMSIDRGQRVHPGRDYFYLKCAYAERIGEAGGTPLLVGPGAPTSDVFSVCDAFVITGGGNLPKRLDPHRADAAAAVANAEDPKRVAWERELIDLIAKSQKPLLGICYGMQLLNLHFGGTLHTDIRSDLPVATIHGGDETVRHPVWIERQSPLLGGLVDPVSVNSSHVQAVAAVAPGFRVTARATDGVIEAIERDRLFGVQWHPEADAGSTAIFARFLELARAATERESAC